LPRICFPKDDEYPVGIFNDSIVSANCSNSVGVNTYDASGFISLPPLLLCAVSHKCLRMFRLCISLLTFTVSLIPEIVFRKFFTKFISQCITSNVYRISSFRKQKHLNKIEQYHSCIVCQVHGHLLVENVSVAK
jgi:hypothetical protein